MLLRSSPKLLGAGAASGPPDRRTHDDPEHPAPARSLRGRRCRLSAAWCRYRILSWDGIRAEHDLSDDDTEGYLESGAGLIERLLDLHGVFQEGAFVVMPSFRTDDFPEGQVRVPPCVCS